MINHLTPEQRAEALYYYFGWQGGTIHQLQSVTGVPGSDLLYREDDCVDTTGGFSAIRTCDCDWRVNRLAPKHQGEWEYWRDVISGYWATGALK